MTTARTMHEEVAEDQLDDILQDPGSARVFAEWRRRFQEGNYDAQYVAAIGQTNRDPKYWPLEQTASFIHVHTGLMSGLYGHVSISVGASPGPDADRAGNAEKLRHVHRLFAAHLDMEQNGADSDGDLSWKQGISLNRSSGLGLITDCGTAPVRMLANVAPWKVPLEVGSSKPSRTFLHLHMEGGVARWPYDSDRITLLLNLETARLWRSNAGQAAVAR
ncbi:hypothetical protein ACFWCM_12830 [Streptomyces albidoflavus]